MCSPTYFFHSPLPPLSLRYFFPPPPGVRPQPSLPRGAALLPIPLPPPAPSHGGGAGPPPRPPPSSRALPWQRRLALRLILPHPTPSHGGSARPSTPSSSLHPPPAPSRSGGGGGGLGGGHGGWIRAGHGGSAAAGDLNPQGAADLRASQRPPHPASCPAAVRRGRLPSGPGQRPNPVAPLPDPPPPPLPDLVGALLSRLVSPGRRPSSPVDVCFS